MSALHRIYEEVLGEGVYPSDGEVEITVDKQIYLNHQLVNYLVELIKTKFVSIDVYQALEDQTQKAENTIRSHIKIEQ